MSKKESFSAGLKREMREVLAPHDPEPAVVITKSEVKVGVRTFEAILELAKALGEEFGPNHAILIAGRGYIIGASNKSDGIVIPQLKAVN